MSEDKDKHPTAAASAAAPARRATIAATWNIKDKIKAFEEEPHHKDAAGGEHDDDEKPHIAARVLADGGFSTERVASARNLLMKTLKFTGSGKEADKEKEKEKEPEKLPARPPPLKHARSLSSGGLSLRKVALTGAAASGATSDDGLSSDVDGGMDTEDDEGGELDDDGKKKYPSIGWDLKHQLLLHVRKSSMAQIPEFDGEGKALESFTSLSPTSSSGPLSPTSSVPASPTACPDADDFEKNTKLQAVFNEFIETEKNFCKRVESLRLVERALRANIDITGAGSSTTEKIVSSVSLEDAIFGTSDTISIIFGHIGEVLDTCKSLVVGLKKLRKDKSVLKGGLRALFNDMMPKIEGSYGPYVRGAHYSLMYRRQIARTNPRFNLFLRRQEYVHEMTLESLQMEPVQRLMRYVLLLREMQKNAPLNKEIASVRGDVEKFVDQVNKDSQDEQARRMLLVLQDALFKNKINLLRAGRVCIRCAYLMKESLKSKAKSERCFVMLFSDGLAYAAITKDKKSGRLKHFVPLACMTVESLDEPKHGFRLLTTMKTITFTAGSDDKRNAWVNDVRNAVKELPATSTMTMGDELEKAIKIPLSAKELTIINDKLPVLDDECPWMN